MNFYDFCKIADKIIFHIPIEDLKKSHLLKDYTIPKEKNKFILFSLKTCYSKLFPKFYDTQRDFTNEYFLDWTTETYNYSGPTIKIKNNNNLYIFLPEEILHIFHNDLSRSHVEIEPRYNICNLMKSFRIPHNPYSNTPFSIKDIKDIISQFILFNENIINWNKFPEVYLFFENFEIILKDTEPLNNYFTIDYLSSFFKKKGLVFVEQYKKKTKLFYENESYWKPKNIKILKNELFYLHILKNK